MADKKDDYKPKQYGYYYGVDRAKIWENWKSHWYDFQRVSLELNASSPVVDTNAMDRAIGKLSHVKVGQLPLGVSDRDLMADIYNMLVKDKPVISKSVPSVRQINRLLVDWLSQMQSVSKLRETTVDNFAASRVAAKSLWDYMHKDEAIIEALRVQEEMSKKQNQQGNGLVQHNWMSWLQDKTGGSPSQEPNVNDDEIREAMRRAIEKLKERLKQDKEYKNFEASVDEATDEADKIDATMRTWGMEPGAWQDDDVETIIKIANKDDTSHVVDRLTKLMGRLEGIARKTEAEMVPTSVGSDIRPEMVKDPLAVMPSQRIYLSDLAPPFLRAKSVFKLFQSGLLGWRRYGSAKHKGHIVAAIDGSGSMGEGDAIREIAAKAIALAVAKSLSGDTTRKWHLFQFDARVYDGVTDESTWMDVVKWASHSPNGGTNYDTAMERSMQIIRQMYDRGYGSADLLFITDGESDIHYTTMMEWQKLREDTNSRMVLMHIGDPRQMSSRMRESANAYVHVGTNTELRHNIDIITERIAKFMADHSDLDDEGGKGNDANDEWVEGYRTIKSE